MQRNLPLGTKDLIRSGIVARFVFLLHNEEFPKLQVRRKKRTHQIVFYDDQCNLWLWYIQWSFLVWSSSRSSNHCCF